MKVISMMQSMVIRKGTRVKWRYGRSFGRGRVEATFHRKVTRTIKGAEVTRFGQKENKVLLIKSDRGGEVLKLENEVEREDLHGEH